MGKGSVDLGKPTTTRAASQDELRRGKDSSPISRKKKISTVAEERIKKQTRQSVDLARTPFKVLKHSKQSEESEYSSVNSDYPEAKTLPDPIQVQYMLTETEVLIAESRKNCEKARIRRDEVTKLFFSKKRGVNDAVREEYKVAQANYEMAQAQFNYYLNVHTRTTAHTRPLVKPEKGINFFSPEAVKKHADYNYEDLNKLLNEKLGLFVDENNDVTNPEKIAQLNNVDKKELKAVLANWNPISYSKETEQNTKNYDVYLEKLQKRHADLLAYKQRMKGLEQSLRDSKAEITGNSQLNECYGKILKQCRGREGYLLAEIADGIRDVFIPHYLEPILLKAARDITECFERCNPDKAISFEKASKGWLEAFKHGEIPNQKNEWARAIFGGIVWFLDKFKNVLLEPFKVIPGEDPKELLGKYVLDCEMTVGEQSCGDGPTMIKFCEIAERLSNAAQQTKEGEAPLDDKETVMDYYTEVSRIKAKKIIFHDEVYKELNQWKHDLRIEKDIKALKVNFEKYNQWKRERRKLEINQDVDYFTDGFNLGSFSQHIQDELKAFKGDKHAIQKLKKLTEELEKIEYLKYSKNGAPTSEYVDMATVEALFDLLMMFLRAPAQQFVVGPLHQLVDALRLIYQKIETNEILRTLNPSSTQAFQTNRLEIKFMPHSIQFNYFAPSTICANGTRETLELNQLMTVNIMKDNADGKLKDTVSVEYAYKKPKDMKERDWRPLKESIATLDHVLQAMGYARMKREVPTETA